jgi:hypothetical protein
MLFPHETKEVAAVAFATLRYDHETGLLYWRVRQGRARAGDMAGNIGSNGHRRVGLLGRYFQAHRIVWLLVHGAWPPFIVDHEDRDGLNNRIGNLRPATKSLNAQNSVSRSDSRTGLRGVGWSNVRKKYRARICVDQKRLTIGYFDDPTEAHRAYLETQAALHPYAPLINQEA